MDCIFCKLIKGDISCSRFYEDENFLAILDIKPVNFGHALLIPKKHFVNILDTPEDVSEKIYAVLKKITIAMQQAFGCDGFNIIQNINEAGGQEVFHSHIHIIPRYKEDGIRLGAPHKTYASNSDMCKWAKKIADILNR